MCYELINVRGDLFGHDGQTSVVLNFFLSKGHLIIL